MFKLNTELLFTWLSRFIVMLACMPVHEAAHAFAADRLGDPTPRNRGRLTLNPLAHLDLFGGILLITAGFGWAKPVPVTPGNFKNPKMGMAVTAAAGPLSNIIMAALLMTAFKAMGYSAQAGTVPGWFGPVARAFFLMMSVNLYLAVFNLLPVPPLDGSRIFGAFLPDRVYFGLMRYERYIMIALIACVYLGAFGGILDAAAEGLFVFLDRVVTLPADLLMGGM
ncbi:MAG: site-2 protease family protein [Oscillospiraceae bacterium]|nr:site-2 protease family protein [Oscillospiraceae bacterium]